MNQWLGVLINVRLYNIYSSKGISTDRLFNMHYKQVHPKKAGILNQYQRDIINEAEINYKAARNKRLHVELVIIKLCYLQQAIELTSDVGGISKKKIVESSLAFRTAAIKPLKVESQK